MSNHCLMLPNTLPARPSAKTPWVVYVQSSPDVAQYSTCSIKCQDSVSSICPIITWCCSILYLLDQVLGLREYMFTNYRPILLNTYLLLERIKKGLRLRLREYMFNYHFKLMLLNTLPARSSRRPSWVYYVQLSPDVAKYSPRIYVNVHGPQASPPPSNLWVYVKLSLNVAQYATC